MAIKIGSYNFEGPFHSADALHNLSGVYTILGSSQPGQYVVLDVGESSTLRDRVANHDRRHQWRRCGFSTLAAAAHYTDGVTRMRIESELRAAYNPPCGLR